MAVVTGAITDIVPALNVKMLLVTAPDTADDGDTIDVDLSLFGCDTLLGIHGFTHSTTGSVVITEDPTTSVTGTILTITIGGSTDNKARAFIVYARGGDDANITAP